MRFEDTGSVNNSYCGVPNFLPRIDPVSSIESAAISRASSRTERNPRLIPFFLLLLLVIYRLALLEDVDLALKHVLGDAVARVAKTAEAEAAAAVADERR